MRSRWLRVNQSAKFPDVSVWRAEAVEPRILLAAVMAAPDVVVYANTVNGPLAPRPGHSFHVSGITSGGSTLSQWQNASAITPSTTNDLVMNVSPFSTNYTACCSVGPAALLTNGITQNQTAPSPSAGAPAFGDGGASDISNTVSAVAAPSGAPATFSYNLGTAGGAQPSATGYDLSEVDVIAGHADTNGRIFLVDILVEPINSSNFLSLSGGQGFSLSSVPNGSGGTFGISVGSTQMAIVNDTPGLPLATSIRALKFVALDTTTFFRELVVTGTPSVATPAAPPPPTAVTASLGPAGPVVSWNASAGATGYTVLRSTSANGAYTAVGSQVGQTSIIDPTAQPGVTYFYEVVASANGDSAPSAPSAAFVTPAYGATEYVFPGQFWQGSTLGGPTNIPLINYSGGDRPNSFPMPAGLPSGGFSAFIQGKITTDLAGPYTFYSNTDDDGYLWVNGQLVSSNGGSHSLQPPVTVTPLTLAAHTAYDFTFLEDNRGGLWTMNLLWQEPTGIGTAGPITTIDSFHLRPAPTPAPVPQQVVAAPLLGGGVRLTWNNPGDVSSYAYVVQRAPADSLGNPTGSFSTVGQVFSGGAGNGVAPFQTWGVSSFIDTGTTGNTYYLYRVGTIQPGQTTPGAFGTSSSVLTPHTVTAALVAGTLNVTLGAAGDSATIASSNNQIVVTEGSGAVFTTAMSGVNTLNVNGISVGSQQVTLTGPLSVSGSISVGQVSGITTNASIAAGQLQLVTPGTITLNGPITTSGPVTLNADSDNNASGTLSVMAPAQVSTGGGNITVHAAQISLVGTFDAGAGSIAFSFSSSDWHATPNVLGHTSSSGTVSITQTASASVVFSDLTGPGLTGLVILSFPATNLVVYGLDTSAGNAEVRLGAASVTVVKAVTTGNAPLTLDAPNVSLQAPVTTGLLTIPPTDNLWINGTTVTAARVVNSGSLHVALGGAVVTGGGVAGTGSSSVGAAVGSGTVAYYRMEGAEGTAASGAGAVADSSGNSINATPVGGPTYSTPVAVSPVPGTGDLNQTAMTFNGTNQRLTISDAPALALTSGMTLEAYVYIQPLAAGMSAGDIIFRGDDRFGLDPYRLSYALRGAGTVTFLVANALGQSGEVTAAVPLNQWFHLAATLDGVTGAMSLYENGVVINTTVTAVRPFGNLTGPNPGLGIGCVQSGNFPAEYFHGMIDEARISNIALSPSQFLDASPHAQGATLAVASIAQTSVDISPTGAMAIQPASPAPNSTSSLTIAPGGRLDLSNNTLTIYYTGQPSPASTVRSYLASGYATGSWNGAGIFSSTAASNPNHNTAIGWADSSDGTGVNTTPNSIELKYTLTGDTNLDGKVDIFDLNALLPHFNTTRDWTAGDSTYNGQVDIFDLNALLPNFNTTLGSQVIPAPSASTAPSPAPTAATSPATLSASTIPQPAPFTVNPIQPPRRKRLFPDRRYH